ncbi:hypothetical protein R1sor_001461 [Riccia sorocarpa]|uniref:Uncharacterized protein n=1 Tax=Riccia sorocarpa TaxID=122646 RepID=A0ABD3GZY8_9MARC
MHRTHHDSNNIQNVLNSTTRSSVAHPMHPSTNKRAPYISHLDSYQIHNLLNPPRGIRDEMMRRGITPRDHHKANVAAIAMKSAKLHMIRNGTWIDLPDAKATSVKNSRNGFSGGAERCETPDNTSVTTSSTQQSKGKKNPPRIDFMTRNREELAAAMANGKRKLTATNTTEPKTTHENYGKIPA